MPEAQEYALTGGMISAAQDAGIDSPTERFRALKQRQGAAMRELDTSIPEIEKHPHPDPQYIERYRQLMARRAASPVPSPPPDLSVLGKTSNALTAGLGMVPEAAAMITQSLYAPTLRHPHVRQLVSGIENHLGQVLSGPAKTAQSMAGAAAQPEPQTPPTQQMSPEQRAHAVATLRVLLQRAPQPPADPYELALDALSKPQQQPERTE